jgi:hypothetical protein
VPTDPTLEPAFIGLLQQTYAADAATQPPRTAAAGAPSEQSDALQTESQRLEQRRQ